MTIKGEIRLQIRIPRYCTIALTTPPYLSKVFRRKVLAHHCHVDCKKPASKCRCQMVRVNRDAS